MAAKAGAAPVPLDKREDFGKICTVAGFYAVLAGVINGISLTELGSPVGYTSGPGVNAGRNLANGDMVGFAKILGVCLNFYAGGIFAGIRGTSLDMMFKGKIPLDVLLSAALLGLGTYMKKSLGRPILAMQIWAFSQGLLNAITSKFSAAPIRATHTAGGMTDAAYGIGQSLVLMGQGKPALPMRKAIVNQVTCWSMFLGGLLSIKTHKKHGIVTVYACAAAIAASAVAFPAYLPPANDHEEQKKD